MKIGISITGVSYEINRKQERYRNYEDAVNEFFEFVINPLKEMGHEVNIYIYTYTSDKKDAILERYNPKKWEFIDYDEQVLIDGLSVQGHNVQKGLEQLVGEDLDIVIRARYDQKFLSNPFEVYDWEWDKVNFLWREESYESLPLVNDTFFSFPYHMLDEMKLALMDAELNPHKGVRIALHNLYQPTIDRVGLENVKLLDGTYMKEAWNKLYKLTRIDRR